MRIAAAWSVDPTTLDDRDDVADEVLVGRAPGDAAAAAEETPRRPWWRFWR